MSVEDKIKCHNEVVLSPVQKEQLRAILEQGIPKISAPYEAIGSHIGANAKQVIAQIKNWQESGLIRRFGLVVKHRKLGFNANAMVVWNVSCQAVEQIAEQLSNFKEVSLCYRRPRRLPDWPYNLFCMIHGTCREVVLKQIEDIANQLQANNPDIEIEKDILFSNKAYKQHGARYGRHIVHEAKKQEYLHG